MRLVLAFVVLALTGTLAGTVAASTVLDYDAARHLLSRTGFGPTDREIQRLIGLSREQAVALILDQDGRVATTPAPQWVAENAPLRYPPRIDLASDDERKLFRQQQVQETMQLRAWWISEMLATPAPLAERMTLFWHNHFVSGEQKVRFARLMYRQNVSLRRNALGNFGDLLHAMARDPAMLIYLDSVQNRKGTPNENFAREAMELFTLGEGHYSERDVKEAARAFTGWSLDRDSGEFVFRRGIHDFDAKTVLGYTGRFDGDAVLDILLAQPATAEFIVGKLWREFVSPDPDADEVSRIARRFRESRYDIKTALRALLTSDAFFASENRGVLIKSPTELVVGTLRQLDIQPADSLIFARASASMGQNLFAPPNVKGWPGQDTWINASSLLARKQFLDRLLRTDDNLATMRTLATNPDALVVVTPLATAAAASVTAASGDMQASSSAATPPVRRVRFDSSRWFAQFGGDDNERRSRAMRLLLPIAPQVEPPATDAPVSVLRSVMLDAAYQLK